MYRLEHRGERTVGVDVARGRQSDAAADSAGQIGEDVAEEVVCDDHVEPSRIGDEEDGRGVDVEVVPGHGWMFGRLRLDGALPQAAGVDEHVGLVHEGELLAALLGEVERVPHEPLDAERGVDAHLVRDLGGSADPDASAVADVRTLGALPHDDEVDRAGVAQRARDAREQLRRPQVHVVVEREPQLEQQPALDDAARELRVARVAADGPEQDRLVLRERGEVVVAEDHAGSRGSAGR